VKFEIPILIPSKDNQKFRSKFLRRNRESNNNNSIQEEHELKKRNHVNVGPGRIGKHGKHPWGRGNARALVVDSLWCLEKAAKSNSSALVVDVTQLRFFKVLGKGVLLRNWFLRLMRRRLRKFVVLLFLRLRFFSIWSYLFFQDLYLRFCWFCFG
jgi:hypothetical protein